MPTQSSESTAIQKDQVRSTKEPGSTRAVVAGSFGNLMENYDNLVYAYSAVTIGKLFFPASSELAGTLYSFAVFGVGFFIRPLGAIAFGHFGDRFGRRAALVVGVLMMGTATTFIGLLPTARSSNLVALVIFCALIALFGMLSDRVGRKPLLLGSAAGFILLSWPVMMMFKNGTVLGVYVGQIIIVVLLAMFSGPGPAALAELFPTKLRYSTMSIGYNFAVMAFGGTAPFIATALVDLTGSKSSPFLLPIGAGVITLGVLLSIRESAHSSLR